MDARLEPQIYQTVGMRSGEWDWGAGLGLDLGRRRVGGDRGWRRPEEKGQHGKGATPRHRQVPNRAAAGSIVAQRFCTSKGGLSLIKC